MIAIKDMEMPSCCMNCEMQIDGLSAGYYCAITEEELNDNNTLNHRHPNCPLVEIEQTDDCVSLKEVEKWLHQHVIISIPSTETQMFEQLEKELPRVTPTHGTCKDCKHCQKRYGDGLKTCLCKKHSCNNKKWSIREDFYCKDFEKRDNKVGWSSLENVREKVERGSEYD